VGHRPGLAGLDRQTRLRPVQRLDLAFLVNRQHHRMARRGHVQPDNVLELGHEFRIARVLEAADAMRLKLVRGPDPLHRP
jgi:hypothetical protein